MEMDEHMAPATGQMPGEEDTAQRLAVLEEALGKNVSNWGL